MPQKEAVITGLGVLSPIGNDNVTFWDSLISGKSGVGFLHIDTENEALRPMGSEVGDFQAKNYIKPRKNIKVMSRDIQMAFVSACLACSDAGLVTEGENVSTAPDRFGVVFGSDLIGAEVDMQIDTFRAGIENGHYVSSKWGTDAMRHIFPLWMLKFLPNMPACQICIGLDARGPSNSITLCRCSSLAAIIEAARHIQSGRADVMIAGGCGNRANQDFQSRINSYLPAPRREDPSTLPRPFDADRCGNVLGEGSGAFVLESREFAEARGARIYAAIRGYAELNEPTLHDTRPTGLAIERSIELTLQRSGRSAADVGFVNADGLGTLHDDRIEAEAVRKMLGDVPVSATKGNFGDLGSGTGAVELAAAVLALHYGIIPPTRNHDRTAADCPINVVHRTPEKLNKKSLIKLNQTRMGRAFALMLEE